MQSHTTLYLIALLATESSNYSKRETLIKKTRPHKQYVGPPCNRTKIYAARVPHEANVPYDANARRCMALLLCTAQWGGLVAEWLACWTQAQ